MLDSGKSIRRAAAALCWSTRRVSARLKLLELPDRAQRLVGDGTIALSAVEGMRAIQSAGATLLEAVLNYVIEYAHEIEPDAIATAPFEVLLDAVEGAEDVFLRPLSEVPLDSLDALQLDSEIVALVEESSELNRTLVGWARPPRFRFSEIEVDRARAAGVLLEYDDQTPLVTDFALYKDLCASTISRGVEELRARVDQREADRLADPAPGASTTSVSSRSASQSDRAEDEMEVREREHRATMRGLAATAHSANLDLGDRLRRDLADVEPNDINVARFFVYGLLGLDSANSYVETNVSAIALRGVRLVVEEFREDATNELKGGGKGALRIVYGDGRDHADEAAWLWKYLAGAKTAGELFGRALVVLAAEHYASRLVLPASQQQRPLPWSSHKDMAIKALEKLAGHHIAPTHKALRKAVETANKQFDEDRKDIKARKRAAAEAARDTAEAEQPHDDDETLETADAAEPAEAHAYEHPDTEGPQSEPSRAGEDPPTSSEPTSSAALGDHHAVASAEQPDVAANNLTTAAPAVCAEGGEEGVDDGPLTVSADAIAEKPGDVVDASDDISF